jgi:hypothetical protein
MKRTTDERPSLDGNGLPESKKRALSSEEAGARFSDGLFDPAKQQKYTDAYATSSPYGLSKYSGLLMALTNMFLFPGTCTVSSAL